ncbi:hypothetical protein PRZ48_006976 [Zasmidium cellare]|uniref:Uncharacterized protein n=1 Tax=Zasmidium cellare TaxID=395010 RepID=A0ABR0EI40_ZASCE|nr:hypothetical protein PRZ48_006976 [Zasmidium cellare]
MDIYPRDMRRNSAADDTKTLATVYEGDEYFDPNPNLESDQPKITKLMSRSRTIEEHDFHHSFKKEDAIDAEQAPRRHNILFCLLFVCFFLAAMIGKHLQGRVMPVDYEPCQYGSSQKRGEDGGPREDLLSDCQNLSLWPEKLQPKSTTSYRKMKPRWETTYTNGSIPAISATGYATGTARATPVCASADGTKTGPVSFGDGSGATTWGPPETIQASNGPASFGTGAVSATAWGPPETIGTTFQTVPYPTRNVSDHAMGTAHATPVCTSANGIKVCNGPQPTGPVSLSTGAGATTWGPPETIETTFKTMLHPTGNISNHGANALYGPPFEPNTKGWRGECHAEPDRKVGDPESCWCFAAGTPQASRNITDAIKHACDYFSKNSLGPAGDDRKQVFASNFLYDDPKVDNHAGRILLKMEWWADANGNDINQRPGGPCLIFRPSWGMCTAAFQSLIEQCNVLGRPDYPNGYGGYGMDSCVMWTIDLDPSKQNVAMPPSIDGQHDYWMGVNPARASESSVSTYTWTPPPAKRTDLSG